MTDIWFAVYLIGMIALAGALGTWISIDMDRQRTRREMALAAAYKRAAIARAALRALEG